MTVTKARIAGMDKDVTKTGNDRRIVLSPRAVAVLERQLALHERIRRAGRIDHEHLFFTKLAQATLTLAWTTSQSNREAAAIIFGLAPECAAILARLGVQSIPHIAESYAHCVRPRWETDARFWRELIRVAAASDSPMQSRLPAVGTYAMQRQLADLVAPSFQPATRETAPTRSNRR